MGNDLLPCPFCGGRATLVKMPHINAPGFGFVVECDECWSKTGYYDYREGAFEAWGRRVNPTYVAPPEECRERIE